MEIAMRNAEAREKKRRFKLCPELVDGDHWTVVDTPDEVADALKLWAENVGSNYSEGDRIVIEVVMMTDAEVDALPDI